MKTHSSKPKNRFRLVQRILSVGGFSILSGFSAFGLTWLVVGIIAGIRFKTLDEKFDFAAKNMPILIAGGIAGFIIGLVYSLKTAKAGPKAIVDFEREYVGFRGRMRIYMGAPIFVIALIAPFFESLLKKFGTETGVYVALGVALAIVGVSLFLYGRIPAKFIIPTGIIGWLLTLSMVIWFAFLRPGAL